MTEYFLRNVTVRDYKWCVNVPPRCSFYTLRTVIMPALVVSIQLIPLSVKKSAKVPRKILSLII